MVAVRVRQDDDVDLPGFDAARVHVAQEDVSLAARVKEDGLLATGDDATEAPRGLQALLVWHVVIDDTEHDLTFRLG